MVLKFLPIFDYNIGSLTVLIDASIYLQSSPQQLLNLIITSSMVPAQKFQSCPLTYNMLFGD